MGGVRLVNPITGELREAKIVTGVDDHSRFCVIAEVVERATGRAVCWPSPRRWPGSGCPRRSHRQRQAVHRPVRHTGRYGEVLFDKICRKNGITHRLTAPASPNQNGKVERFHGTFRPDFLDDADRSPHRGGQAAVDGGSTYNSDRPHQGLTTKMPVLPADRFAPAPGEERRPGELWLPPLPSIIRSSRRRRPDRPGARAGPAAPWPVPAVRSSSTAWFPPSGNMRVRQPVLARPARAGCRAVLDRHR